MPAVSTEPTLTAGRTVTVMPGDSLYVIARHNNVQARDVITLNHLQPPYVLQVGQVLQLPAGRAYTVRPGDSLSAIAERFHMDTAQLASRNQIAAPNYIIRVGQVLSVPEGAGDAPPPPQPERKPEANPIHGVAPGSIQATPLAPPPAGAPRPLSPQTAALPPSTKTGWPPAASPTSWRG